MQGELPLSNRLLKHTHTILMQGVHGEHKTPGEFRVSESWIGGYQRNRVYLFERYITLFGT